MIKAENYGKITGNFRNLPENSLKNPKILAMDGERGVRLRRTGGGLPIFSMTGGVLADPPPIGHVWSRPNLITEYDSGR